MSKHPGCPLFIFAMKLLALFVSGVAAVFPLVDLGYSKYQGVNTGNGVSHWLGMRYAAAPVGDLRFRSPADPVKTDGVQAADQHGKICLATGSNDFNSQSEDCLFIDVFAPSNATINSKLPVFLFIQGGGFTSNSNSNYDGVGLVKAGDNAMIVVTFGYRVGPYGFLTYGNQIKANNGLWDQVKAMEWVKKYISKFGGDPNHVVIGGDSAGAGSIAYHLTRDGGKDQGLFVGAAAESVSFSTILTVSQSQYLYDGFATRAGCATRDSLHCLRSKTAQELQIANVNAQPFPGAQHPQLFAWNPVIDGDFITEVTYDAMEKGKFVKVPVLMGDDTNGGTIFTPRNTATTAEVNTFMHDQFPYLTLGDLYDIDNMYPPTDCSSPGCKWRLLSDIYGDMRYMCPTLFMSQQYAKSGKSWNYRWNVEDPGQVNEGLGVPHTAEVHAVFGPENTRNTAPASYYKGGENANAVTVAQGYWTSFIRTLDPNKLRAKGSVEWQQAGGWKRIVVNTGGQTQMESVVGERRSRCVFFKNIGPRILQ